MADRDVRVRILSEYYDQGSKAAERATRRLAALQMAATNEDIAREARRAAAVVEANRKQAEAMTSMGRATMTASLVVAAGLGLSAKAAMDWESAWAGVTKTVDGSPEQMAALERELRGLARTLPATHEEIAGVAEAAGQLGVKRADVADFTRTMINMGETTNLSADEAATSIAQLANIMGVGADKADEMGSAIVALGNDGASTEADIVSMSLRIAGAGRTVGMSTDQVLAYASALSSVGIEAEAGGTAISRVMIQIGNDVDTGSARIERYAQVAGMSAEEFATAWRDDAATALAAFIGGLGKLQAQGGNTTTVLDELGFSEVRVSDALRRSALAGDLLTESLETGSIAWAENNALAAEAAKRYETAESRLATARNQINDAAIDIGGTFLPVLASAAEGVGSLAAGFQSLTPTQQEWVTNLGAAASGLGLVVGGAAVAIPKLKELQDTIVALRGGSSVAGKAIGGLASVLTGPWGLAIAAATIGLGVWMKAQGDAARMTQSLADTLDNQTGSLTDNSTAWIASELTKDQSFGINNTKSMADAAREMGISLELLTRAYEGQPDAIAAAKAAAQEWADEQRGSFDIMAGADAQMQRFTRNLDDQSQRLTDAGEIVKAKAAIDEAAGGSAEVAAAGAAELTGALTEQEQIAEDVTTALDDLAKALDDLNGPTLDSREAQRQWYDQLVEVNDALKENGATLDVTTDAGRRNQEALDGLARSGKDRAQALLEETGSIDEFNASLEASRQALHDNAVAFGMSDEAAWDYVDSVLAIPETATTQAILDDAQARSKVESLKRILATIPNVVITADMRTQGGYYANRADGGWAGPGAPQVAAANGLDRQSMIARGGANILWAEPETGWEAYISGKPSQRERNIGILGDVASRFGLYVGRLAGAGAAGAASGTGGAQINVSVTADAGLAAAYGYDVANKVTTRLRDTLAAHGLTIGG